MQGQTGLRHAATAAACIAAATYAGSSCDAGTTSDQGEPPPGLTPLQQAVAAPTIGVSGDRFTLNGAPTFLLGVSYFDAFNYKTSDLDSMQVYKFNLVRFWMHWRPPNGSSFYESDGTISSTNQARLLGFVRAAGARGMVVDVTLLQAGGDGSFVDTSPSLTASKAAVRNTIRLLNNEPNVIFDLCNEHDHSSAAGKTPTLSHADVQTLFDEAIAANPSAIVTVSGTGRHLVDDLTVNQANVAAELAVVNGTRKLDLITPHFTRTPDWSAKTDQRIRLLRSQLSRTVPIYLQEENRRGYNGALSTQAEFEQAATRAKAAGAAGWIFHTGAGFDLRDAATMWNQLDAVEQSTFRSLAGEVWPSAGITTINAAAEADTYIDSRYPTSNFGAAASVSVGGGPSARIAYLRFNITTLPAGVTVTGAQIKVRASNPSNTSGGAIRQFNVATPTWAETGANGPTYGAPLAGSDATTTDLSSVGATTTNGTYSFTNLQSAIVTNGRVTFVVRSSASDGASYYSREEAVTSRRPILEITYQ